MPTRYVAHRGGAAQWPENSLTAFRNAIALGARVLELDVHQTADGVVAVIHDPTLDRTTSGHGPVARATAADLARVRLRGRDGVFTDDHVPTLDEVLAIGCAGWRGDAGGDQDAGPGRSLRAPGRAGRGGTRAPLRGTGAQGARRCGRAGMTERAFVMAFNPRGARRSARAGAHPGDRLPGRSPPRGELGRPPGRYRHVGDRGSRELRGHALLAV